MSSTDQIYKKQNSFAVLTLHACLKDVSPRILKVCENLDSFRLSNYQKRIVKDSCDELFEKKMPDNGNVPFKLYPYNIEEINRLADDELPRYLFYRYRYDTFPQRLKLDNFPPCLQIEPTSICNYRCPFCYQIDSEFTKKSSGMMGMMSLDLFKMVIDQAEGNCEAVTLASRGEPLLCSDIEEMLAYTTGKFLALKLNTNAWFLDEAKCHSILQSGVNTLVFSADAASEPAYSNLRVNGDLDRVHKNIKRFQDIRFKHYPKSRIITRVSGVKVPGTDDLDTMERFWGEQADQVAFVDYNPWENVYDQPVNDINEPCSDLWRRMFVWWDGKVNPCDSDFKSTLETGMASSQGLSKIWLSDKYTALRKQHQAKDRSDCSPCNRCAVI
jgi:radical SAM protein with 4Fe4S-binding SPASM domain